LVDGRDPFRVSVHVFDDHVDQVHEDWVRRVSQRALALAAGSNFVGGVAGVVIANDETVRDLNRTHRGLDETTDVLAFSNIREGLYYGEDRLAEPAGKDQEFITPPQEVKEFGEIIVSYHQAARQAREAVHSVEKELATLLVHGMLHLLGYDHEDPDEEAEMAARQEAVLAEVLKIE
jgi:probable rRNA maturation factor